MRQIARLQLIEERKSRWWTQQKVADLLGTTRYNVGRWEAGSTTPGPYFRAKISELFGKSPQELGLFSHQRSEEQPSQLMATLNASSTPSSIQGLQSPIWDIPYPRNPFFTGRRELLHNIHEILHCTQPTFLTHTLAISGLGGVGKTQIALEYAYQYRNDYRYVFWVNATTRETLSDNLIKITNFLQLLDLCEQSLEKTLLVLGEWFATHQEWLLIIDNMNDIAMIQEMMPIESEGHLLLTTRMQALGTLAQRIEIECMGIVEGMLFLLHRAKLLPSQALLDQATEDQLANAEAIVIALDSLPLALDQAGSYIDETGCCLSAYLDMYQTHHEELLHRCSYMPTTYYSESVATTWSLNFQEIEQVNPIAADLLRLCAFLEPGAIPEELFVSAPLFHDSVIDTLELNEAIEVLRRFSLVQRNPDARLLRIHCLVQIILKDTMNREEELHYAERAIKATITLFPKPGGPIICSDSRRYLPQAQACCMLSHNYGFVFTEAVLLFTCAANYLSNHALHEQAELLRQWTLHAHQQTQEFAPSRGTNSTKFLSEFAAEHERHEKTVLPYQMTNTTSLGPLQAQQTRKTLMKEKAIEHQFRQPQISRALNSLAVVLIVVLLVGGTVGLVNLRNPAQKLNPSTQSTTSDQNSGRSLSNLDCSHTFIDVRSNSPDNGEHTICSQGKETSLQWINVINQQKITLQSVYADANRLIVKYAESGKSASLPSHGMLLHQVTIQAGTQIRVEKMAVSSGEPYYNRTTNQMIYLASYSTQWVPVDTQRLQVTAEFSALSFVQTTSPDYSLTFALPFHTQRRIALLNQGIIINGFHIVIRQVIVTASETSLLLKPDAVLAPYQSLNLDAIVNGSKSLAIEPTTESKANGEYSTTTDWSLLIPEDWLAQPTTWTVRFRSNGLPLGKGSSDLTFTVPR